jgi:magnesium-transporting ATPase (P-type)
VLVDSSGSAPLTAVQLLWVNMIMDTLGALALATEPPNDELMKRTPVGRKGNFISNTMWRNIMGQAIYQFLVIWYLQSRGKRLFWIDEGAADADLVLNTVIFNCFVFCQVTKLPVTIAWQSMVTGHLRCLRVLNISLDVFFSFPFYHVKLAALTDFLLGRACRFSTR